MTAKTSRNPLWWLLGSVLAAAVPAALLSLVFPRYAGYFLIAAGTCWTGYMAFALGQSWRHPEGTSETRALSVVLLAALPAPGFEDLLRGLLHRNPAGAMAPDWSRVQLGLAWCAAASAFLGVMFAIGRLSSERSQHGHSGLA